MFCVRRSFKKMSLKRSKILRKSQDSISKVQLASLTKPKLELTTAPRNGYPVLSTVREILSLSYL